MSKNEDLKGSNNILHTKPKDTEICVKKETIQTDVYSLKRYWMFINLRTNVLAVLLHLKVGWFNADTV